MLISIVLECKNVVKVYKQGKNEVRALDNINLTVREGELISILGPSGSGKSTLLHLLGALDLPSDGKIYIGGEDTSELSREKLAKLRQKVGFVFQYFNLIPRFDAFTNVELAMTLQNVDSRERYKQVLEMLRMVGLQARATHKPHQLSGGQKQRVAIARALVQNPNFLLMDEPTGNVDTKTRDQLLTLVKILNEKQNVTVIIITHDPEIAKITDRTLYLVDGKFVEEMDTVNKPVTLIHKEPKKKKKKRG